MGRSHLRFGRPFSHISLQLTSPTGRKYIPSVVKRGDSSAGAGIRGVPGKANSYPFAKGADLNTKNNKGQTPLQIAVDSKHKDFEELLRKHGAK